MNRNTCAIIGVGLLLGRRPLAQQSQALVYGNSQDQAYSRRSEAKPVTFTCVVCGTEKTEFRFPGFKPRYCKQACADQAAAESNERRVIAQREKRRTARKQAKSFQ